MIDGEDKLIERAVKGEASAFGHLYDHYQPRIYRFVFIKVGQREEAEDLTHQAFLNAWQNIQNYEHRGFPFSSWLYQIARNQVIDYYRTSRSNLSIDDADPENFVGPENTQSAAEQKFELAEIRLALIQLKPDYQDVIVLRFVEELSLKETAEALERSEGAVKLLQHRALQELRKNLTRKK